MDFIAILIAVIGIILGIVALVTMAGLKANYDQLNKRESDFEDFSRKEFSKYENLGDMTGLNNSRGPQGPRGPAGPVGPPGGFYSASGPLVNMYSKKVGTPTFGKGLYSIVYLDDKHYSPIQYWFLENNSNGTVKIKNKFSGQCLTTSNLGDVYSDPYRDNDINQSFLWNNSMQLSSQGQANQCISVADFSRNNNNSANDYNLDTLQAQPNTNVGTVQKMKLEACSASLNPKQTWYIGQ